MDKFLQFLYGQSQVDEAAQLDIEAIFEALESIEKIQMRRKPLEKAVRELGVKEGDFEVEEGVVLSLILKDSEEFRKAAAILGDVNKINELAELGWVAVVAGDVAGQTEEGIFRINFVPVDEAELSDTEVKPGDNKLVAKAADEMNEPGTEDTTDTEDRRRDLPKGVGSDASQFESYEPAPYGYCEEPIPCADGKCKFVQSSYNHTWWLKFPDDRPRKFIGVEEYLPEYAKRVLAGRKNSHAEAGASAPQVEAKDAPGYSHHGRELSVPERHQLKIAKDTLRMSDEGAHIMGGMTKEEARDIIMRFTGRGVKESVESEAAALVDKLLNQ